MDGGGGGGGIVDPSFVVHNRLLCVCENQEKKVVKVVECELLQCALLATLPPPPPPPRDLATKAGFRGAYSTVHAIVLQHASLLSMLAPESVADRWKEAPVLFAYVFADVLLHGVVGLTHVTATTA